ncbi:MAG: hypothetical protein ACKO3I_00820 [Synechococcales cyanobacterium]
MKADIFQNLLGTFAITDNTQITASTDRLLGAFGLTDNLEKRVQGLDAEPANNRVNLAADNGATGRLIWSHSNDVPKFLGENMNETQLKAGKSCAAQINLSRLNKTASTFDIYLTLTEAGWCTITPA